MGTRLKIPMERAISTRVQGNIDQRSPHKKEAVQMKSQDLLSDVPEFRLLCLPPTGCVTLDTFLNYSEPKCPYL